MTSAGFLCNECGKSFTAKKNLNRHVEYTHRKNEFTCEKCAKQFTRVDNLQKHLIKCNPKRPVSLNCEKCLKNYSTRSNLNKHMKIHGASIEVLWMMDGQKIEFTKHLDLEYQNQNITKTKHPFTTKSKRKLYK